MNGTVGKRDDVTGAAAGTMRVVRALVPPEPSEVGVRVAVKTVGIIRIKDKAFVFCSVEVFGNALEGGFVGSLGVEGVPSTLVDGKSNVRASVTGNIEKHPNDAGVVEEAGGRRTVRVFGKRGGLSGCFELIEGSGELLGNATSINDLLDEAWLR